MAGIARDPDLIDRIRRLEKRVRVLETTKTPRNTENFIMDPVVVRAFPAVAAPARATILGVHARLDGGGPITASMYVIRDDPPGDEPNPWLLHTFTDIPGDGSVQFYELADPFDIQRGDTYYPVIDSGSGSNVTLSFELAE